MKKARIAYCIPALYYPSGMERVLILKANYLVRHGYEVHIILTDGGDKPPYFPLDPSVKLHQLDIDLKSHTVMRFLAACGSTRCVCEF